MKNSNFQAAVENFVNDLKSTHGTNLVSIMLYGSAVNGQEAEVGSELNVLVALAKITPEDLRLAQAPVREWQRIGNPLPVYFTSEELRDAADVFPIEFRNMERARRILYGVDPFEEIQLSDENMRHQTEYELRSKLIQLRRLYIPASTSLERMTALMTDSLASFAALFRAALLLNNIEPPLSKTETVRATARHLNLNINTFERIFELRSNKSVLKSDEEANSLFADYMLQIEHVVRAVDGFKIMPAQG